jgi:hypothetical protein
LLADGKRFLSYVELAQEREQAQAQAEQERQRAQLAQAQLEALHALLKERGINPEQL